MSWAISITILKAIARVAINFKNKDNTSGF